jgi:hypothetical protein
MNKQFFHHVVVARPPSWQLARALAASQSSIHHFFPNRLFLGRRPVGKYFDWKFGEEEEDKKSLLGRLLFISAVASASDRRIFVARFDAGKKS